MRGLVGNYYVKVDTESSESIKETSMSLKDAGITRLCFLQEERRPRRIREREEQGS